MRLIDADKLIALLNKKYGGDENINESVLYLVGAISGATTVDAEPVVRCKDCKHRDPEDHKCDSGALERAGCIFPVQDDYFCSCGERREDATD
ncbi:MAG: hypothetical protein IKE23_12970 [Exiguobacterium sp.]|nr:hypothetical protein [Exiguobacterium sp.]